MHANAKMPASKINKSKSKLLLLLAVSLAAIIILASIYQLNKPKISKAKTKTNQSRQVKTNLAAKQQIVPTTASTDESYYQKPIELVLVIKEAPAAAIWAKASVAELSPNAPSIVKHKNVSSEAEIAEAISFNQGKVIAIIGSQYIFEIPAKNQSNLLKDLKQFGQINGAPTSESASQGIALIYLTIEK